MRRGTKLILGALVTLGIAIVLGVGVPAGPEALLILIIVVIPGYILYRVALWIMSFFRGDEG